jgi:glycosyl-4,4'-diaponeurosporenoate acyltransferase
MEGAQREHALMAMAAPASLLPVISSAGLWLGGSLVVGALANQLPLAWLSARAALVSPAVLASRLDAYQRHLKIRWWKHWIPDAGNALPGGITKASLARRDQPALLRLMAETRRAELVHWALWPLWLLTLLWLPSSGVALNALFATLFNLPCLLLQRYNRLRLQLLLARRTPALRAPASPPPT